MVLEYSTCIFVSFSSCIHPCVFYPSTLARSCNKRPFIILYSKETPQPTDKIRTRLESKTTQLGSMVYCIPILRCLLSPSNFPLLPGGFSHSACEYWSRLWRHDQKCQLQKTGEPVCGCRGHLSAELSVCTALKRFCRTMQSDVRPQVFAYRVIIWFFLYPFKECLDGFCLICRVSSCSVANNSVFIYTVIILYNHQN